MKHALRQLLKSPGFTVVALLTLALGIGANTAMFTLVDTLLFSSAPYPEPQQLVRIYRTSPQSQTWSHSLPDLLDAQTASRTLSSLTAFQWWSFSVSEPGQPAQRLNGVVASPNIFATLGVHPTLGRSFTPDEQQPGRDRVAVISHDFWRRHFAADPNVIGRALRVDAEEITVIGVLPESSAYPLFWGNIDLWRPIPLTDDWRQERSTHWLNAIGRLRPDATLASAQAELSGIAAQLAQHYPATNSGGSFRAIPLQRSATSATERHLSWFALGLSGFVLLIACANLANLQLARTAERAREFAVRAALGASRARLMRQLLAENLLLSAAGGALGLLLASWLADALGRLLAFGGGHVELSLDFTVLGFALLASLLTGVLFGLAPAWLASRFDINTALKSQSRGSTSDGSSQRLRHALIVGEVALALALLSGAGFFIRGLQRYMAADPGWQTAGLLSGTITLPEKRYPTPEHRRALYRDIELRLASVPGLENFALCTDVPLAADHNANSVASLFVQGRPTPPPGQAPVASYTVVSPSYFATLQIPLVSGRLFADNLRPDGPRPVIINETMARQLWPGEDPIGRQFSTTADNPSQEEVIGVVRDVGYAAYAGVPDTRMQFYRPLVQEPWGYITVVLRAAAPETYAEPLRRLVAAIDPDLAITDVRTIEQAAHDRQRTFYVINDVLAGFALLGLALSAVGLYGVISGAVVRRLPEFGIRLALGATPQNVLRLVLGKGIALTLAGLALGTAASLALVRLLSSLLPGLPGQDPWILVFNLALLLTTATFACYWPARRATKVDPLTALRAE